MWVSFFRENIAGLRLEVMIQAMATVINHQSVSKDKLTLLNFYDTAFIFRYKS